MSTSQEVRTVFTWDTTDVDKGVQRMEKAMDRLKNSESRTSRGNAGSASAHGAAGGSNFAMGLRDLMEGRGVNAMQRFGHAIGATSTRLAVYMGAVKAAGAATRFLLDEIDRGNVNARKLEGEFVVNNRGASFATGGNSPSDLAGLRQKNVDALQAENEQQSGLVTAAGILKAMHNGNPLSSAAASGIEAMNAFQGKRSPEEELAASKGRAAVYSKEEPRLHGLYTSSLSAQTEIARLNAPGDEGDPFAAKRRQLEIQQQVEESQAKAARASKEDLQYIAERYQYLQKTVTAESELAGMKHDAALRQLAIEGGSTTGFRRSLALSAEKLSSSQALLNSGDLDQAGHRAEMLNVAREKNAQRDAIAGRYLNPDGTRRREADIQADFRKDAEAQRARGRFNRRYDAGGYDPVTGRRRATGDKPGSGLHSGGLESGHLESGGLGGAGFRDLFPHPPVSSVPGAGNTDSKTTGDLYGLLDARLPKTTA